MLLAHDTIEALIIETCKNIHYAERYLRLVDSFRVLKRKKSKDYHAHHILPRSLFPDFAKDKNNLVLVTPREHYLLHWILSYSHGGSMVHAFYQMSIHPKYSIRITGKQYENAKKRFSGDISKRKFYKLDGKIRRMHVDDELVTSGAAIPSRPTYTIPTGNQSMKGRVTVFDNSSGLYTSLPVSEIDYENYVPAGCVRDETSRQKTSAALSGRIHAFDEITGKRVFVKSINEVPSGYSIGIKGQSEIAKKRFTGKKHAYNPVTGESGRYAECDIPDGWVFGRVNNKNPFSGVFLVTNPWTDEKMKIKSGEVPPKNFGNKGCLYVFSYTNKETGMNLYSLSCKRLVRASGVKINKCYIESPSDLDYIFSRGTKKGESPLSLGFRRTPIQEWDANLSGFEWV